MGFVFLKEYLLVGECDICYSCNLLDFLFFFIRCGFFLIIILRKYIWIYGKVIIFFCLFFFCMGFELFWVVIDKLVF